MDGINFVRVMILIRLPKEKDNFLILHFFNLLHDYGGLVVAQGDFSFHAHAGIFTNNTCTLFHHVGRKLISPVFC